MINVTKTYLPDKEKYLSYVDKIYNSGWITNNGPLVRELEARLAHYLGVKNIVLVANGTIALEIAYRLLKLDGKVITTPFSFVATTSSLVANGLTPIFSDINPTTYNLDWEKIQSAISKQVSAIVPVHVFGNACEVEKIQDIANKHNLKVIYDAAHAFGVTYKGDSILNYGDISTLSFHATKLFHTIEGGALIIADDALVQDARYLINFGIDGPDSVSALGTNAKMNEFEAAMGLCVLDEIEMILEPRKNIYDFYTQELKGHIQCQELNSDSTQNYSYFPIVFDTDQQREDAQKVMNNNGIFPRRYFSPSLDTLCYLDGRQKMPISRDISNRILCLPIYPSLTHIQQSKIIDCIKEIVGK